MFPPAIAYTVPWRLCAFGGTFNPNYTEKLRRNKLELIYKDITAYYRDILKIYQFYAKNTAKINDVIYYIIIIFPL